MKHARLAMGAAALAVAGLFAGCTATTRTDSTASMNDTTMSGATTTGSSATTSTAGSTTAQMDHPAADMKAMCAMHDRVMKAQTDAEREAALDANVRAMAPAEKKQYIDMMHKHCM